MKYINGTAVRDAGNRTAAATGPGGDPDQDTPAGDASQSSPDVALVDIDTTGLHVNEDENENEDDSGARTLAANPAIIANDNPGPIGPASPRIDISSTGADVVKREGDSGATAYLFTVSRSGANGASTVDYAVSGAPGGGTALTGGDFAGAALPHGTIRFANGESSKLLTIEVAGDTRIESNERFNVTLSNPGNATLGLSSDFGIINNDDSANGGASIDISSNSADTIKNEGDSGATPYRFTVTRASAGGAASVQYAVSGAAGDGGALSGGDFVGGVLPSGTIRFASGETSKVLTINVAGDSTVESSERFNVNLSRPINATLGQSSQLGIIGNDDTGAAVASIAIGSSAADTIKNEGGGGATAYTFTVSRSAGNGAASVKYAVTGVADGVSTAADNDDFAGRVLPSGIIRFAGGETSKQLTISVAGDAVAEHNERFNVTLSNPTNATLGQSRDFAIIVNDDGALGLALAANHAAHQNRAADYASRLPSAPGGHAIAIDARGDPFPDPLATPDPAPTDYSWQRASFFL